VIPAELLSAVADHPDEDGVRLACIDWLLEYGGEPEWQAYLDRFPDHHDTRARFGGWLSERGDARGEGYRALGGDSFSVHYCTITKLWTWYRYYDGKRNHDCQDWFFAILNGDHIGGSTVGNCYGDYGVYFSTRREAEDAAALGFATRPADRRAELLRGTGAPVA
jgi:uncharacterized protein (TIGR02996 family)